LNRRHAGVLDWRHSTRKTDLPIGNQDLERTFWRRRRITLSHGKARSSMSFSCENNENLEWLCNSVKLNSDNNFVLLNHTGVEDFHNLMRTRSVCLALSTKTTPCSSFKEVFFCGRRKPHTCIEPCFRNTFPKKVYMFQHSLLKT
jgi:hypothetical protein